MNITIIGASAGVGLEAVKRGLERSHYITTLSRSGIALPTNSNLNAIQGSATNPSDLKKCLANADAVLVTLGTGTSMKATTLYSDFAKILVQVQKQENLTIPFIILTGFGAGDSWNYQSGWFTRIFFSLLLKAVYADKTKMEEIISESDMKWCIVRPGMLKSKSLTEHYRDETKLYKGIHIGGINRADVADFMIKQAENPTGLFLYHGLSNE